MKKKIVILIIIILVSFVLVITSLYSLRKAMLSLLLIIFGIAFTFVPLLYIGKMLKFDIEIMKNGERQIGRCIKYERGSCARFGALIVEFEDRNGRTRHIRYNALRIYFKYPHNITIYKLDNSYNYSNLGILTIIREALYFSFFFAIWLVCSVGTIHLITEIL